MIGRAHWPFTIDMYFDAIDLVSPDYDGSCEPHPASSTTILDLGAWAGCCLPPAPYDPLGDFNCDGMVGVIDLGIWAGGLGLGCGSAPCP